MLAILDIETKPNESLLPIFMDGIRAPKTYKDPEKIAEFIENKKTDSHKAMSVDTDYSEIFCIGYKELGQDPKLVTLQELRDIIEQHCMTSPISFITFNGKKFDIPIIMKNGLRQGINFNYRQLSDMCQRFKANSHYDLMEILGDFNDYKSLDTYLQIYLGIKKKEIDFDTCTDDELRAHCLEDLINTEKLYEFFKPMIN